MRGPKRPPRGAKEAPRGPSSSQEAPRSFKTAPKGLPRGFPGDPVPNKHPRGLRPTTQARKPHGAARLRLLLGRALGGSPSGEAMRILSLAS